jgi:enoyl-CoA hydratase/carnithine racemase
MPITLAIDQGVAVVTLENPPANAYDGAILRELSAHIARIREDSAARAVVVRSAIPKFFCAGADISTLRNSDKQSFANLLVHAHEVMDEITNTPKIFVAAIAGHCIGGGLELALSCDLRFAAKGSFRLGLGEINLGLSPGMGGTQRLPRLIPKSKALHLMITGETVPPHEALSLGLIDRIYPEDKFWEETLAYARKLAQGPSLAQGYIKLSVNRGLEASLQEGLAIERAHQNLLFGTEDAQEGVRAFLEKRPAKFSGK